MPTLMWIAFWSCMLGAATSWQETMPHRREETGRSKEKPGALSA